MSDFSKPVVTDNYATLLPALVTELKDLARALDPATTGTHTNMPSGTVRWNSASAYWEKYNGTSWAPLAATYAIGISGNAATATTAAACSGNAVTASSAVTATKAGALGTGGVGGAAMTFNWSGQAGQPTWLWGGSDGSNMYVYNPSNFSVASAAACTGNAATATTAAACSGNAVTASTATTASSCSGNSATATSAATCTGNSATATKAGAVGSGGTGGTSLGFTATDSVGTPARVWGSAAGGAAATLFTPANFSVASAGNATNLGGVAASGYARSGANTDITSASGLTSLSSANTIALLGASSTAGTGIAFPATPAPSANPNTLDDYEEGTWTPSLGGDATYNDRGGRYTKIGRMVFVSGFFNINIVGTGSNTTVSGLPFPSASAGVGSSVTVGSWSFIDSVVYAIHGVIAAGNSFVVFNCVTAAGQTTVIRSLFKSSTIFRFSAAYETD